MVNWAAPQNRGFGERDLYRWICTAGFVQLDVQMLYSIKYCVQAGIGWYRLDLPSVGPRGTAVVQCTCAARQWADAPLGRPICFLPYKIGDTCLNKDWCFSHPASGLSPFVSTFVSYPHGFWFRPALPIALTFTLGDCACMHGDCACMPLCYSNIPKTYSNNSAPAACPRS